MNPARASTELVVSGLDQPTYITSLPGQPDSLVILEKSGLIKTFTENAGLNTWLDLSGVVNDAAQGGLLGIAFDPDYANNGRFYVRYTQNDASETLQRITHTGGGFTGESLLTFMPDGFADTGAVGAHVGGWIGFGPDGMLYAAIGDGSGNPFDPHNRSQSLTAPTPADAANNTQFLGKILRLDVSSAVGYTTPADNPFGSEIYALGLRNPWRASFDRATGDMWIGDVGQFSWEEISRVTQAQLAGANFEWSFREGTNPTPVPDPASPAGTLFAPVLEYNHVPGVTPIDGQAVTGGYVYRGDIASLQGQYFFGDFITGDVWSFDPANPAGTITEWSVLFDSSGGDVNHVASFGEDTAGRLYIVDFDGEIYRVIPEPGSALLAVAGLLMIFRKRR